MTRIRPMTNEQRHKQRILTTIVVLCVFLLSFIVFVLCSQVASLETTLVITFLIAILALTLYQSYNYRFCHERVTLVNTLTQIYFGVILIVSLLLMLLLQWLFSIEITTSYIILSAIVILFVFLTLQRYDAFLEEHVPRRLRHIKGRIKKGG